MYGIEDIFSVAGKVVLVSGGGSGLGKAIATGFAENGAKVYITGRRQEALDQAAKEIGASATKGGSVATIRGDVATKDGCAKIAEAVGAKEPKLDVLVNCAGVMKPWRGDAHPDDPEAVMKQMLATEDEDFNYTNEINVNGVFFLTAQLLPLLRQSEAASVIVIASIAGLANQRAMGSVTYGVSKAATIHLGTLLAGRLQPFKIRVNTICPGIFPSEMTGAVATYEHTGMAAPAQRAGLRNSLGRAGRPEEIVGPCLLLASKAGGYMDGTTFTVDGGRLMAAGVNDGIRLPDETYTFPEAFKALEL